MLDQLGSWLQDALDSVEATARRRGVGSVLLGVALGIGVMAVGIAVFIFVFAVLVELVP